ncbi:MAG TPA: RNA polymerase sigma factor [Gaiellaceae bacterium]|nr:RNA polymerase sigma factor [Gaiellaceae bacterium]
MAAAGDAGRAGDSVANATHDLYRQYGKQIYAYCLHQLRSREEAEDAVQTTFLNAFRGLQRGTTTRFEQAWLYKIAQNVCIARRSSSGRRLRVEAPDDFEILEEIVPSGSGSAADTLELVGLEDALEQMPENQRRAILLREWQGLSYREIASQLDLSQGAVEMLIFRARKTLALALEEPEAAKRRTGKAKTGFSFGSLIAAMKGLFSTGAALKMAAVAVSAAVVSTNAVHSVVHRITTQRHMRAAAASQVRHASATSVVIPKETVQLVSWKASRTKVVTAGGGGAAPATSTAAGTSGPRPIIASDAPAPAAPAAADGPAPPDSASAGDGADSSVAPAAPAAIHAPSGTGPSNPPPPPPPPGGSGTSEGSGGQGSGSSGGGGRHHGHGGGDTGGSSGSSQGAGGAGGSQGTTGGTDTDGKGSGRHHQGGKHSGTTDTTTTGATVTTTTTDTTQTDTTTTDATTTTTTTPTSDAGDSSSSSDTSGTTTQTTTTTLTTTTTPGDGGGSDGGSSSSGGGGHGHGGGDGNGGSGDGGDGSGGGHHGHGH